MSALGQKQTYAVQSPCPLCPISDCESGYGARLKPGLTTNRGQRFRLGLSPTWLACLAISRQVAIPRNLGGHRSRPNPCNGFAVLSYIKSSPVVACCGRLARLAGTLARRARANLMLQQLARRSARHRILALIQRQSDLRRGQYHCQQRGHDPGSSASLAASPYRILMAEGSPGTLGDVW